MGMQHGQSIAPPAGNFERNDSAITFEYDRLQGVLRVVGTGDCNADQLDEHFGKLRPFIGEIRVPGIPLKAIIDLRARPVSGASVAERIGYWIERVYLPDDRIAVLLSSAILKMQVRRISSVGRMAFFETDEHAVAWLLDKRTSAR